jgi:DNA invertase Pin-like site-specific DNA recombinase
MREYGYIRVSTKEQNLDRQFKSMIDAGVKEELIFEEKQSGKDFDRPQYQLIKKILQKGDTLFIKELDRLGRNADQIKEEWKAITDKGSNIVVLDMPILDTRQYKNGMEKVITNIVLELLSYMAEREREKIKVRQAEGIAAAKAKGKLLGRPHATYPKEFTKHYEQWKSGEITAVKAMELLSMKRTTFYKLVKQYEEKQQS